MQLNRPFLRLPIRFDADALAAEVRALPPSAWAPHPTGFVGNEAVRLVTPGGELTDELEGPMAPTEHLRRCAYVRQVMAELAAVWGRSRFMGLGAGAEVPSHIDTHYYWRTHLRIHIPVITNPGVQFTCGDETVHMAAGECWVFDSFRWHDVQNKGSQQRIHLVIDTVGGGRLPALMAAAESGAAIEPQFLKPGARAGDGLVFERVNSPTVMSPWEMRCHLAFLAAQATPDPLLPDVLLTVERFIDAWAATWARFGTDQQGYPAYAQLIQQLRGHLQAMRGGHLTLRNELSLYGVLDQMVLVTALAPPRAQQVTTGQRLAS